MPTRTHSSDPFAPRSSLSQEQLLAYAQGRLSPAEAHEVELHLEQDPLLREAAEGLKQPGAIAGAQELARTRPSGGSNVALWFGTAAVGIIVVALIGWYASQRPEELAMPKADQIAAIEEEPMPPLQHLEITAAVEQPESLVIGHELPALHVLPTTTDSSPVVRDPIVRVEPVVTAHFDTASVADVEPVASAPRPSRQLMFIHDLKIIHPKELYNGDPLMTVNDEHVSARYADRDAQVENDRAQLNVAYTSFMEDALSRFAQHDHRGCLDDLRFLLTQYPNDVNALFYSGLCSYNLGLYKRAERFLGRAASHPIDVFNEEAAWYHALTLEKLGENAKAQEEFARIATAGGFYSDKAKERLNPPSGIAN